MRKARLGIQKTLINLIQFILIGCRGDHCGTVSVCESQSLVTGGVYALDRINLEIVCMNFLTHALRAYDFTKIILERSPFRRISRQSVCGIRIAIPCMEEQQRIADILDEVESLRNHQEKAIRKLDQLTESMFVEVVGDPLTNPLD